LGKDCERWFGSILHPLESLLQVSRLEPGVTFMLLARSVKKHGSTLSSQEEVKFIPKRINTDYDLPVIVSNAEAGHDLTK